MLSKQEIQLISKLRQKKFRESEQQFVAEGKRLVCEGLNSEFSCQKILVSSDFNIKEKDFLENLRLNFISIIILSNKDFSKIATTKNPQGIAAVFKIPQVKSLKFDEKLIICLENISDPGNVGTILRSCDWFGIKSVVLSKGCADIYNPKVLRASMGAIFNLQIIENADLTYVINELKQKKYSTYFADMEGIDYRDVDFQKKSSITFCNEAFGPSEELIKVCQNPITIPKKGKIDSLNVAAAAAVILSRIS